MIASDISIVHQFIDNGIDELEQLDLMIPSYSDMPAEMRDTVRQLKDGSIRWKAIPSIVSTSDIQELEDKIHLRYPNLYKELLCYKHFYELFPVKEITLFRHDTKEWKENLLRIYFKSWLPSEIIEKGYIPFADYSDWGIVCFDTHTQSSDDYDCQIVMIDHELLFDNPVPKDTIYSSFATMMRSLLEEQQNPNQSEDE